MRPRPSSFFNILRPLKNVPTPFPAGSGRRIRRSRLNQARHPGRGFSLLEVLVSLLILGVGLLGLAALQTRGLKFNHDAYVRSQATILAYDIMDKMRANRDNADTYRDPLPDVVCNNLQGGAANERRCWHERVKALLPGGTTSVATNGTDADLYDVTLTWYDRETQQTVNQLWIFRP